MKMMRQKLFLAWLLSLMLTGMFSTFLPQVQAGTESTPLLARLTIGFDDAKESIYLLAKDAMDERGLKGFVAVPTGDVGKAERMTWTQIKTLYDSDWEVSSHSVNHASLTSPARNETYIISELNNSKVAIENHGMQVYTFIEPNANWNNTLTEYFSHYYYYRRGNDGSFPYQPTSATSNYHIQNTTSVATAMAQIDSAINTPKWVHIFFHDIVNSNANSSTKYLYSDFITILNYVNTKVDAELLDVTTMRESFQSTIYENLVPNASFESLTTGWADDWTRNDVINITIDDTSRGFLPTYTHSLKINGTMGTRTATSDYITRPVGYDTFPVRTYFRGENLVSGTVWLRVIEYDANNVQLGTADIIGCAATNKDAENKSTQYQDYLYSVIKSGVAKFKIQLRTTNLAGGEVYLDDVQFGRISIWREANLFTYNTNLQSESLPYLTDVVNGTIYALTYASPKLSFTVSASSGTTSTTNVHVGNRGEPLTVEVNEMGVPKNYDSATNILTVTVGHSSSAQIEIEWNAQEMAVIILLRSNYYLVFALISIIPIIVGATIIVGLVKGKDTITMKDIYAFTSIIVSIILAYIIIISVMNAIIGG